MASFLSLTPRKIKKLHKAFTWLTVFSLILQIGSGVFLSRPAFAEEITPPETTVEETVTPVEEPAPTEEAPAEEVQSEPVYGELAESAEDPVEEPIEEVVEEEPAEEPILTVEQEEVIEEPIVDEEVSEETAVEEEITKEPEVDLEEPEVAEESAELNPSVFTDKGDYAPGETVKITGENFPPNTTLLIKVTRPDGSVVKGDGSFEEGSDEVITDEEGRLEYLYQLNGIEGEYLVEVFLGAVVLTSTTFTDSPVANGCGPLSGAIWTTDLTCSAVNLNLYDNKTDVYLNGGPQGGGAGLPDGNYYVKVTEPDGTHLGDSGSNTISASGGNLTCTNLFTLTSFADTTNPGGAYKVWLSPDPTFPNQCSKTDNFKVKRQDESFCGDGTVDSGEECDDGNSEDGDGCSFDCTTEEEECVEGATWASAVAGFNQGTRKDGSSVLPERSDPNDVLGSPDSPQPTVNFVSLGVGGSIIVSFSGWIIDVDGDDLSFHETTWGREGYPIEKAGVEVSQDGSNWFGSWEVTNHDGGDGIGYVDFSSTGLPWIKFVKITDTTNYGPFGNDADGYDLDAVDATEQVCEEPGDHGTCGNGVVEENEQCDDGNQNNDDYCPNDCQWNQVCLPDVNMVANGGFENPVVTASQAWDIFDSGTPGLGWIVEWRESFPDYGGWTLPSPAHLELHRGVSGWLPYSGDQHAELDTDWNDHTSTLNGEPASVRIYQDLPTIPGYQYQVKFHFSPRPSTDAANNQLQFSWNSSVIDTFSRAGGGNTDWSEHEYAFTATGTPTRLQFTDVGTADSLGTFIDDVSVICLEEEQECGNGQVEGDEECDGQDGVTPGVNFCTHTCELVPIYDGEHSCPEGLVRSEEPIASYSISGTDPDGETFALTIGGKYLFEASGTFRPTSPAGWYADAGYTTNNYWSSLATQYGIQGIPPDYGAHALLGDFGSGVGIIDWGSYNPNHVYTKYYEPAVSSFQFLIGDRYDNWFDTSWNNQGGMSDNSGNLTLNVYECQPSQVTIKAYKVVCDDEQYLPNWGNHGSTINQNSAQSWVDGSGGQCQLVEDWKFQYGPAGAGSFGSFQTETDEKGAPWQTFNVNSDALINDLSNMGGRIEVREVFPNGDYFGFTNGSNVSAEFYCTGDVYNYDNWEWINNPQYGQTYYCVAFNAPLTGSISGHKWEDLDGDAYWDGGESALDGWTIFLDENSNQTLDVGEVSTLTSGGGAYSFADLLPGNYDVCEVLEPGWTRTLPGVGLDCYNLTILPGQELTDYDFGNFELGKIRVCKYDDLDGGQGDPVPGVTMNLYKVPANLIGSALESNPINLEPDTCVTDETGCCVFDGLYFGTYRVSEIVPPFYLQTYPTNPNYHRVPVQSGTDAEVYFLNTPLEPEISIAKENDKSGGASAGDTINYTLTLTNGPVPLIVDVTDVMPSGFSYVAGSGEVDGVPLEPTVSGNVLTWGLLSFGPDQVKVVTYQAIIDGGQPAGTYYNLATCRGSTGGGNLVDTFAIAQFIRPVLTAECDVVESSVPIGQTFSYSTKIEGTVLGVATVVGQVLGAATGATTVWLILALLMILSGLMIINWKKIKDLHWKKIFKGIILSLAFLIFLAGSALAAVQVKINDLPDYLNRTDFKVYYTALDTSVSPSYSVAGWLKKEGGSWKQFDVTKTEPSGFFQTKGENFDGEGKYDFKIVANGVESSIETVTLDFTSPETPREYRKERISSTAFKLRWRNPPDSDFAKVLVYRSEKQDFDADDSSKIGERGGLPDQEMDFVDSILPADKEYFYALRAIDWAGNASALVGDGGSVTETITEITPTPGGIAPEVVTLPAREAEEGQILGGEVEAPTPTEAPGGIAGAVAGISGEGGSRNLLLGLGGLIIIGIVVYLLYRRRS